MTKKRVMAIVLSLVMIMGIMPGLSISVSAADELPSDMNPSVMTYSDGPYYDETGREVEKYWSLHANGKHIIIEAGTVAGTAVYYMDGNTKKYINKHGAAGDDFSECSIFSGISYWDAKGKNSSATEYYKDLSVTMNGGTVFEITGGAKGNSFGQSYKYHGENRITINGGTVENVINVDYNTNTQNTVVRINGGNIDILHLACPYGSGISTDYYLYNVDVIIRGGNVKYVSDHDFDLAHRVNPNNVRFICMPSNVNVNHGSIHDGYQWSEFRNAGGTWILKGHGNITLPEGETVIVKSGETFLPNYGDTKYYFGNNYTLTNNGAILCYGTPGYYADKVLGNPVVVIKDGNTIEITSGEYFAYCTKLINEGILPANINFVLMNDISMSGIEYIPLGSKETGYLDSYELYVGTFDGNGKTISGLGVGVANGYGLAAYLGGTVKNLTISNATISPDNRYKDGAAGAIAHRNFGTISNCVVKNSRIYLGEHRFHGGIAGANYYSSAVIENCAAINNTYKRQGAAYGGYYDIVGIKYPYLIGGLVNYNTGTVKNCYVYNCNIDSGENATAYDGFIMPSYYENIDATNCYVYGGSGAVVVGDSAKTQEEFENGYMAWLLNAEGTNSAWGQNLDNGETNAGYPTPGGAAVYKVENCNNDIVYSNTNENKGHVFVDGQCTVCKMNSPAPDENNDGIYEIANLHNFIWFAQAVNAGETDIDAILVADIDAEDEYIIPVGTVENPYTGIFDGQGYTIKNALMPALKQNYCGMFGVASGGAVIKNFTVENKNMAISGENYVAGILGASVGEGVVTIENCGNKATILANKYAGGIFGGSIDGKATIKIINCYNTDLISATDGENGGLAGDLGNAAGSTVENCYSIGDVISNNGTSVSFAGGTAQFVNCYALVAQENVATVSKQEVKNGALANKLGEAFGQNLEDTNATHPILGGKPVYYYRQGVCTEDEADYEFVYTNQKTNGEYSYIHNEEIGEEGYDENGFCLKCGGYQKAEQNSDGKYEIDNAGKLYWFAKYVNSGNWQRSAVQTKDIVINKNLMNKLEISSEDYSALVKSGEEVREWIPIGSSDGNGFGGEYDGNGYTISGLYINNPTEKYAGFISKTASGSVKGLTIDNSYIRGKAAGALVGLASKYTYAGTIFANRVLNSFVVADNYAGGVVAYIETGSAVRNIVYDTVVYSPLSHGAIAGYISSQGKVGTDYATDGTCDKLVGFNAGGSVEEAQFKAKAAFASGEVTYLLNEGETAQFYQIIGTDSLPVFYGLENECEGGVVYAGYTGCDATEISYSNTELYAEIPGHSYDNTCDTACNKCNHTREITHTYDNDCDEYCNVCNYYRAITHTYSAECDEYCDVCDAHRYVTHEFDNACDITCNRGCGYIREPSHSYDYYAEYEYTERYHWRSCTVCSEPEYSEHYLQYSDNNDGTHSETCSVCDYKTEGKTHQTAYADNGDNTHSPLCKDCGYIDEASVQSHTLDADGFCSVCNGYEMGDINDNGTPDDDWDDYYEISRIGQLYWMASQINSGRNTYMHIELMNDIDVNPGYKFNADGTFTGGESPRVWIPAGNGDWTYFTGSFYGNGHTISGLYVNDEEADYVGLFGHIAYNPVLTDVTISNSYLSGNENVGAVVGYGEVYMSLVSADETVTVKGNSEVGGIAGYLSGDLSNSYSVANVPGIFEANYTGGLVGSSNANITNCYTTKELLAGYQNEGSYGGVITNCYYYREDDGRESDNYEGTTRKLMEQFASGEVAYLLQAGVAEDGYYDENDEWVTYIPEIWGQRIGVDTHPVPGGAKVFFDNGCYYNEKADFAILENGVSEGKATATVAIPTAGTYTLIFADCNGTTLNTIDSVTFTVTEDKVGIMIVPSEIDIALGTGDKIMLWQDMTNLVPLCEAYIVK